jgi:hypothetical protein
MRRSIRTGIALALGMGMALVGGVCAAAAQSPAVDVGSASGAPGATVQIPVKLVNGGGQVAAASVDISYDGTQVNVQLKANGKPDCAINPAIGQSSATSKSLLASQPSAANAKVLRVGVIGTDNANPIPDGLLLTCKFTIAAGATPGAKVLNNTPSASGGAAQALTVQGTNGSIVVRSKRQRRHS